MRGRLLMAGALALLLGACDTDDPVVVIGPGNDPPENLVAEYRWLLGGWIPFSDPRDPIGDASVQLSWDVPRDWGGEPFRVYGRREGSSYQPIATVTSCAAERCVYSDINVVGGRSYEYYVVAVDEQRGAEGERSDEVFADVPVYSQPAAPSPVSAQAFNNALLLRWQHPDAGRIRSTLVYLVDDGGSPVFFQVGETDGTAFLDTRARNGVRYTYRLAAVDTLGHVSLLSASASGTPSSTLPSFSLGTAGAAGVHVAGAAEPVKSFPGVERGARLEVVGGKYRVE